MKDKRVALVEIQRIATVAEQNFQVWWALVNRVLPTYQNALNLYADFFTVCMDACKRVFLLELGRLLDEHKDALGLKRYFAKYDVRDASIQREYHEWLLTHAKVVKAIRTIRDKAIAHQDAKFDTESVFTAADVSTNEIRAFMDGIIDIVRKLIRDVEPGAGQITDSLRYQYATMALIKDINDWHLNDPKENRKIWLSPPFNVAH